MKRLICILLALLLCVSLCACSLPFGAKEHVHTWRSATCASPAVCETCGETLGEPLPHSYGAPVMDLPAGKVTDGKQHRTCSVCGFVLNEEIPATGSEGLSYERNEDGASCTVTGLGTCTDTELFIPAAIDGLTVTTIGTLAFEDCAELTTVHIPNTVTEIKSSAFVFCEGLTEVTVPDSVVTLGSSVFVGCENLQTVTLSQNITGVLDGVFSECESLQSVNIPAGITGIDGNCFRACKSLQAIQIPVGVTYIGIDTFLGCKSLKEVEVPEGVTSLGYNSFFTAGLERITLPSTLKEIGCQSFGDCHDLKEIRFNGTTELWDSVYLESGWDNGAGDYTVICTDGQIH